MALDELKEDNTLVTVNDVELLIAENVLPYTKGNVIDYLDSERGKGFTIGAAFSGC